MNETGKHIQIRNEQPFLDIRGIMRGIVQYEDFAGLLDLQETYGDEAVRIEDPTGHYPVTTAAIRDIQAEVTNGRIRFYWSSDGYDSHHPGRQFTMKPHNIGALSLAGTNQ